MAAAGRSGFRMFPCSVSSGPSQNLGGVHIGRGDHIRFESQILKKYKSFLWETYKNIFPHRVFQLREKYLYHEDFFIFSINNESRVCSSNLRLAERLALC